MRYLAQVLTLTVCFLSISAIGQNQKFAHINRTELLQMMPEFKKAQTDLEKYSKQLESQIDNLMQEYRGKLESYQSNASTMSSTILKDKERELQQLQERIQTFQQEAQQDVAKKEQDLLEPILSKIEDAISQVAKEKGYTYVFDSATGALLYADDSDDIMAEVKVKLGM